MSEPVEPTPPTQDPPLRFRAPSNTSSSTPPRKSTFDPPPPSFLHGTWHVTHSTLPMWKSNRNVAISYSYTAADTSSTTGSTPPDPATTTKTPLISTVTYQPLSSAKLKTVTGIETPDPAVPGAYKWRGKGLLKIASSQWEVLGWGEEEGGWMVTMFQKTLFTPRGVDIYVRRKGGVSEGLVGRIKEGMVVGGGGGGGRGDGGLEGLRGEMFEIRHDWDGEGSGGVVGS